MKAQNIGGTFLTVSLSLQCLPTDFQKCFHFNKSKASNPWKCACDIEGQQTRNWKKRCPNIFKGRSAIIQNAFPAWRKTQRTLMSNGCFCKQRDRAGRSGHTDRWTATVCVTATWKNRSLFPHSHCVECMREDFCRVCWSVSHRQCRGRKWGEAFLGWRRVLWRQCSRKIHYDLPSKKS